MSRAQRLAPPETAFRLSHGRKRPREEEASHLEFIRSLPCLVTGQVGGIEACHVRYGDALFGKRECGKAEKPSDCWTVPLHYLQHRDQHSGDERAWWAGIRMDPLQVALALHRATGDRDAALAILDEARNRRMPSI